MAINSELRNKMREVNKKRIISGTNDNDTAESSVDKALQDIEKKENEINRENPDSVDDTNFVDDIVEERETRGDGNSRMSVQLKRGNKALKNVAKSFRLTEKAARNMDRLSKEYEISENELINQLLEQL